MKTLTVAATKQEEIDYYNEFLASLQPGTYLHSMFAKTGGRVEQEIRNDFAIGPVENIIREREEAQKALADLNQRKVLLEKELRDKERELVRFRAAILDIKTQARRLAD